MKRPLIGAVAALLVIAGAAAQQQQQRPANQQPRTVAQQPAPAATTPPTPVDPPPAGPGKYVGLASCVNSGCHGSTEPLNQTRALQNEYYTWLNQDRHAQAYNVLFNERSARIAKNMKLRGRAYEEKVCLDCHTTNVPASQVSGVLDKEDGIQCEMCHGPASGWRDEHIQLGWKHEDSVARGMIDLRSVTRRGQTCLQCHLGNAQKEVDHELIASGHPILAFELDNYTESMPPHWTPGRESHGLRAWATGQVVKFRESLDLVARHARGPEWPEFADMSCFNCHHDLKGSTWRQERGWPDRAGLPTWSPQHWAVLRLIIDRVSPAAKTELDPLVRNLSLAVARMGDREAVTRNAEAARRVVDRLVPQMEAKTWSDADVRAMMTTIVNDQRFILESDVHAAEQAALSLQSLSSTMTRRDRRLLRSNLTRSIDALFEEIQNRDDYDPARFVTKLNAVKQAL
jgi:hypothetical protein